MSQDKAAALYSMALAVLVKEAAIPPAIPTNLSGAPSRRPIPLPTTPTVQQTQAKPGITTPAVT